MLEDFAFLRDLHDPALDAGCVLTIGKFDGVHCGHRAILRDVRAHAERLGVPAAVLTFEPHPKTVFRGEAPETFRLMPTEQREAALRDAGADVVLTARFTPQFAGLTPTAFVESLLIETLHAKGVHVGYDFNFGKGRAGDTETLQELTTPHGIVTHVHAPVTLGGEPVSSTRIRGCVERGEVAEAAELLGAPLTFVGTTAAGAGRGKGMGIPTLNLYPTGRLLPPHGVYAVRLWHAGVAYQAIANLGCRPTFEDDDRVSLETLSLDPFEVEARGLHIRVELLGFIRPEQRFESTDALRAQIGVDVQAAKAIHAAATA